MTDSKDVGIQFTETMRGYVSTDPNQDHRLAELTGERAGQVLEFTVTITFNDLEAMLQDPDHSGRIEGAVTAPVLSAEPLEIEEGVFNLFERDPDHNNAFFMRYRMTLSGDQGRRFHFEGVKQIRDDAGLDMWRDTTTLFVDITNEDGTFAARGIMHIRIPDFARQLGTVQAIGAGDKTEALWAVSRFGVFFEEILRMAYAGSLAPSESISMPESGRPLRCGEPSIMPITTEDGVELRLTRFEGGAKGPVLLTPGFGTSTLAYTANTVDTNLPEYMFEQGYDVWLLDYRSSPDLTAASTQFSLDDIARYDYPAAVDTVRDRTGAETIQVIAHCVGSLTFQMAQALGLQGVRSAICSQLTMHPHPPLLNRIKSGLHLAQLLDTAGVESLSTDFDDDWSDNILDVFMRLYPSRYQRSASPVLRRILFMYGDVIKLENLNRATYEAIPDMFGVANMATFRHLGRILREGHVVASNGDEAYLPHADRLKLPIMFLHGAENNLFLPEGSAETMRFLSERNGAEWYTREVIPNYAHMDCFIGKDAATDVYPLIGAALNRHN